MPRQVEMADEQNFVQLGRMVQNGLVGNEETTKWILRVQNIKKIATF